jgi:L-seryl-tRNA(Ser) seleniumtransferase
MEEDLRKLPSVDEVVRDKRLKDFISRYSHEQAVTLIREVIEEARQRILAGVSGEEMKDLVPQVLARAGSWERRALKAVINATGVILHTNLCRAPLSREALKAMADAASGYCNLEYDLEEGERGPRAPQIESLLCTLTGAESSLIVNNNAAAVLLCLAAVAKGREVVVSRGELVEIGGEFRLPDVIVQGGCVLREVGSTNHTYLRDFEAAVNENTAAFLKAHTSNFRIVGFTSSVSAKELCALAHEKGLPVIEDLGSGSLLDTASFGLSPEPTIPSTVGAGIDLVTFSCDKLLGGPQAGVVVGKKEWVERLRKHPLARALRVDKLILAGLGATLQHYVKGEAPQKVPVWQMISAPLPSLEKRVKALERKLDKAGLESGMVASTATVGGGSLPGETLPSKALVLWSAGTPQELSRQLRLSDPPVVPRIEEDTLMLDLRTVLPEQDPTLAEALLRLKVLKKK